MRDAVDKIPRAYPTRDCEYGILAVGVPTRESRSPKVWEAGGGSFRINTRAPSGGGAGNDSGGQKQAVRRGRPTKPLPPTLSPGMAPFFRTFLPSSLGQAGLVWFRGFSLL